MKVVYDINQFKNTPEFGTEYLVVQIVESNSFSQSEWEGYENGDVVGYKIPRDMAPNETLDSWYSPSSQRVRHVYSIHPSSLPSFLEDIGELKDSSQATAQYELKRTMDLVGIENFNPSFFRLTMREYVDHMNKFGNIYDYIENTDELKRLRKVESEEALRKYLLNNPLISNVHGGKDAEYSVSFEKQSQMVAQFAKYELQKNAFVNTGIMPAEQNRLTWNASGEMCEVWTEEEFAHLVAQVNAYVYPIVEYQRYLETLIYTAESREDVLAVEINFDKYKDWWARQEEPEA